jgi:hypothetical protein
MTGPEAEKRCKAIMAELSEIGFCLPGSLVEQRRTCSTPGCHCHDDPSLLHGPYRLWTRKVNGKTQTRALTEEQVSRYRGWIDNSRRLHELVAELEQLSAVVMAHEASWPEPPAAAPDRRRNRRSQVVATKQVGKRRVKAGK